VCEVRAATQRRANERKGTRIKTDGRVKPWSCTSSGGLDPALARRSLFFSTRRRFLWGDKSLTRIRIRYPDPLGNVIEHMEHRCLTNGRSGLNVTPGDIQVPVRSQDSKQINLQRPDFYKGVSINQ
jgi:hypothetical protein